METEAKQKAKEEAENELKEQKDKLLEQEKEINKYIEDMKKKLKAECDTYKQQLKDCAQKNYDDMVTYLFGEIIAAGIIVIIITMAEIVCHSDVIRIIASDIGVLSYIGYGGWVTIKGILGFLLWMLWLMGTFYFEPSKMESVLLLILRVAIILAVLVISTMIGSQTAATTIEIIAVIYGLMRLWWSFNHTK